MKTAASPMPSKPTGGRESDLRSVRFACPTDACGLASHRQTSPELARYPQGSPINLLTGRAAPGALSARVGRVLAPVRRTTRGRHLGASGLAVAVLTGAARVARAVPRCAVLAGAFGVTVAEVTAAGRKCRLASRVSTPGARTTGAAASVGSAARVRALAAWYARTGGVGASKVGAARLTRCAFSARAAASVGATEPCFASVALRDAVGRYGRFCAAPRQHHHHQEIAHRQSIPALAAAHNCAGFQVAA